MVSRAAPAARSDEPRGQAVRVLVAVRDGFERAAISDALERDGLTPVVAGVGDEALAALERSDPHVVVTDLDTSIGSSVGELLDHVYRQRPWVGLVALTSHASPQLALPAGQTPPNTILLVKSRISSLDDITQAVRRAIESSHASQSPADGASPIVLTQAQADILRLIAEGYSNAGIARVRGTTLRATESLVQRTLQAMQINADADHNPRVLAVRRWLEGEIVVR